MPIVTKQTKRSVVKALVLAEILYAFAAIMLTLHVFASPASAYDTEDLRVALNLEATVQDMERKLNRITVPDNFCYPDGFEKRFKFRRHLRDIKEDAEGYLDQVAPIYQEFVVRGNSPSGAHFSQDIDRLKNLWSRIRHVRDIADHKDNEARKTKVIDCGTGTNTQASPTPPPKQQPTGPEEQETGLSDLDEDMADFSTPPEYRKVEVPEISSDCFLSQSDKTKKRIEVAENRRDAAMNWTLAASRAGAFRRALKVVTVATDRQQLEQWLEKAEQQKDEWRALWDELEILYRYVKNIPICPKPLVSGTPTLENSPNGNSSESDIASDDMGLDIPRRTYESVDIPRIPESALCDEHLKDQLIYTAEQAVRAASANDAVAVMWLAQLRHALDNNLGNRPAVQRVRREAIADIDHWKAKKEEALKAVKAAKTIQVIDCEQKLSDLRMPSAPQQDQRSTFDELNQQKHLEALQNNLFQHKPKEQPVPRSYTPPPFQVEWDLSNSSQINMIDSRSRMQNAADAFFGSNRTDAGPTPGGVSTSQPNKGLNFPQAAPSGSQRFRLTPNDSGVQTSNGIAPITSQTISPSNQPAKPNRSQGFQNGKSTVNGIPIGLNNQPNRLVGTTGTPQQSVSGMTRLEPEPLQFVPGTAVSGVNVIPPSPNGKTTTQGLQGTVTGN